jgi:hypothetical protein
LDLYKQVLEAREILDPIVDAVEKLKGLKLDD